MTIQQSNHLHEEEGIGIGQTCCSRRLFLVATATSFGALLAACSSKSSSSASTDATDIPEGSSIIVGDFIFSQPTKGTYKAWSTVCPHQGHKISEVHGATVECPTHNSVFNISDGSVVSGPARSGMTPANLSNEGTTLTASS